MTNDLINRLGFESDEKVVIFHCDDIGMNQGSVAAYQDLKDFGIALSGSTMVPCPWFLKAAELCREQADADMGVHLTLTSEWQHYRWRPLTAGLANTGLVDSLGFFHASEYDCWQQAKPQAVFAEACAQVEAALAAGITVSHLDSHMLSMMSAKTLPVFYQVAQKYQLPMLAMHSDYLNRTPRFINHTEMALTETPLCPEHASVAATTAQMEQAAEPLFDHWCSLPYQDDSNRVEAVKQCLQQLPNGVSFFMLHPSIEDDELKRICPDMDWRIRVADYQAMLDKGLKAYIKQQGIRLISFQQILALKNHSS
ncbi:ChbG/HpnK family deacetylase [Motilimonas pumila]|uniref:ChbG/HpnK family deacetylase n=1 Tax=Motilimonas pumila TaxID=2303987 RepID=A0A418YHF2_9GAMM|nr:ChbG/HpnK family deacetylase [Motilimonas pumila]RJG49521.1 ChbG/HpnK family deacetylase [Motilimonas pumila]